MYNLKDIKNDSINFYNKLIECQCKVTYNGKTLYEGYYDVNYDYKNKDLSKVVIDFEFDNNHFIVTETHNYASDKLYQLMENKEFNDIRNDYKLYNKVMNLANDLPYYGICEEREITSKGVNYTKLFEHLTLQSINEKQIHHKVNLSQDSIKKLKDSGVCDGNIDAVCDQIKKHISIINLNVQQYEEFFSDHELSDIYWGRGNSAMEMFTNLFAKRDNLNTFTKILEESGFTDVNNLIAHSGGNLFKDICKGWEEEAKTIASWTYSKSAASGPAEILLKFMLKDILYPQKKDGLSKNGGDVWVYPGQEIEVKATTLGKSSKGQDIKSGGHPIGQRKAFDGNDIKDDIAIYEYINARLLKDNGYGYFRNTHYFAQFNEKLIKTELFKKQKYREITDIIVDALCYQYGFLGPVNESEEEKKSIDNKSRENIENNTHIEALKSKAYSLLSKVINRNGFSDFKQVLDVIGCVQLYLYSKIEEFKYFFCIIIDKNIENESAKNGKYVIYTDSQLIDFDTILKELTFGVLDGSSKSRGSTGKIMFRNVR